VRSIVFRDHKTGLNRGLVVFSSEAEAEAALNTMDEVELDGRRIKVTIANARRPG
jgi:cold-inducible RNA-binding protein